MSRATQLAAITLVLAAGCQMPAANAQQSPPADPSKVENVDRSAPRAPGNSPVQLLDLSERLAAYGRANKDALSLVVAAQIFKAAGVKVVERKAENSGPDAAAPGDEAPSVAGLLREAREVSGNDETIVAIATDIEASATKGRVGGVLSSPGQVSPKGEQVHTMSFQGERRAEIYISGGGTGSLLLEVYDQGGHKMCLDPRENLCDFTPFWTGDFKVKVLNSGAGAARYRISTN